MILPLVLLFAGVEAPRFGCLVDRAGALRWLMGVRGAFVLSEAVMEGVASAACSGGLTVVRTGTDLRALDGEGRTVASVGVGEGAARMVAWKGRLLARVGDRWWSWDGKSWEAVEGAEDESVTFTGNWVRWGGADELEFEEAVLGVSPLGREALHVRTARCDYAVVRDGEVLVPYLLPGETK